MQKTELKNSSFFNEISLEYKATNFPQDYVKTEEGQISLSDGLKAKNKFDYFIWRYNLIDLSFRLKMKYLNSFFKEP